MKQIEEAEGTEVSGASPDDKEKKELTENEKEDHNKEKFYGMADEISNKLLTMPDDEG